MRAAQSSGRIGDEEIRSSCDTTKGLTGGKRAVLMATSLQAAKEVGEILGCSESKSRNLQEWAARPRQSAD
eukprot:6078968-Pleurochrysis_carterae.AAC.1